MLLYFTEDYCSISNRKEMIHMTKEKYLAKLRQQLLFRLSNSEIDEIVSDMEECFDQIPKRMLIKGHAAPNLQLYVILTVVFVSAAMILLSVSLWKNAPKFFAAVPLIPIVYIAYNGIWLCRSYSGWTGDRHEIYDIAGIGVGFSNIITTGFICAAAFLLWSFIHRNALTLASAYAAMAVTGFMFYWYYILATMDPTDNSSLAFLFLKTTSGKNYVIWGTVIAAAVLVLTIISKLAKRKKVG